MHAHTLEPVNSLLEGLDIKDDYLDVTDKIQARINNREKGKVDNKEEISGTENTKRSIKRQKRESRPYGKIDEILADKNKLIPDWDGYYIGDVWSAQRSENRQRLRDRQSENVNSLNAQRPLYYENIDNHG